MLQSKPNLPAIAPIASLVGSGLKTLAIDIGGTHLKAGLLNPAGTMIGTQVRTSTMHPAPPDIVIPALIDLAAELDAFDRISIGFPGAVRDGIVHTAPNLGDKEWAGFALASTLKSKLGKPARLLNDATVQGLGVITGTQIECVITLGTGMGFALYRNGIPAPHLELGQHIARKGKTYDEYVGAEALDDIGRKHWNRRVARVIDQLRVLVGFNALYIGGGNAAHIKFDLAPNIQIVSNEAGITGGVRLWDTRLDHVFEAGED